MKVHEYKNIEEYKEIQLRGHYNSREGVWAQEGDIEYITAYLKENFDVSNFSFGICHGSKIGVENGWFEKHLGIKMLGTDLGPPKDPVNNIEWDFHEVKDEWIDAVDVIYSNAFDHSYDPKMCLTQWMKCIKKTGACFLEWTPWHGEANSGPVDPFGATLEEYKQLVVDCGFEVKEILSKRFEVNQYHNRGSTQKHFVVVVHPNAGGE